MPSFVFVSQDKDNPEKKYTYYHYKDYEDYVKHNDFYVWQELHRREMINESQERQEAESRIEKALQSKAVEKKLEEAVAEEIAKKLKL